MGVAGEEGIANTTKVRRTVNCRKETGILSQGLGMFRLETIISNNRRSLRQGQPFLTGYLDGSMRPLYDFGYGLSYTSFAVENVKVSAEIFHPGDTLTVTADVVILANRPGAEAVAALDPRRGRLYRETGKRAEGI